MGRTFNILIYILLITIQVSIVRANVQIDSVKCTPSACVNDGSMVVYANTNNPPLLYFINDGPLTTSLQSSNQFNSLMPGVYQVIAMDWTGSSDTQFALVQGNYVFPKFSYNIKNISCNNASDAAIFASPLSGKPPYSWKLTNQQTGLSTTLNVPTFSNLSAGDYVLAMTDHCQNTYIQQIHIAPTTTYTTINTGNNFHILDCNTVKFPLSFNTNVNPPIHYTIKTKSNTSTGVIASFTTAQYVTVSGISYGDTVQITAINSCNDTATQTIHVPEFKFLANVAIIQTSCTSQNTIVSLSIPNISNIDVAVSYTVKDSATGAVVLSGSANHFSSIPLNNLPLGKTYLFTVGDVCGNSSTGFFYLPSPGAVVTKLEEFPDYIHCMDSTAYFVVKYSGFYNAPKLTLLSGPPLIKSTKPKYAYTDNIQYNKTINPINGFMFRLKNLNAGTYTYRVFENSCGISITDSFQISPAQLSNDNYKVSFKKGCPGNNQIYLSLYTAKDTSVTKVTTGVFTVQSVGNSPPTTYSRYFSHNSHLFNLYDDTIKYLNSGKYLLTIEYQGTGYDGVPPMSSTYDCWTVIDTIEIPPSMPPVISHANQMQCNGSYYIELQVNPISGTPPYNYEIVGGQQTYPPQQMEWFQFNQPGTYTAKITDFCGISTTYNFSVDTLSYIPIFKVGSSCLNGSFMLFGFSSPFFTYKWKTPNGAILFGDTLKIDTTSINDLGTYELTRYLHINGCIDSTTTTYELKPGAEVHIAKTICAGDTLQMNNNSYYTEGHYQFNIQGNGCDTLVNLHLTTSYQYQDKLIEICPGESAYVLGKKYDTAGIFYDTIISTPCHQILILDVRTNDYKRSSELLKICAGEKLKWNNKVLTSTGIYRDTIGTSTCDSIVTLYLYVSDMEYERYYDSICEGEQYNWRNRLLQEAGVYEDTLKSLPCYKVFQLHLTTLQLPDLLPVQNSFYIKEGDALTLYSCVRGNEYTWLPALYVLEQTDTTLLIQPDETISYSHQVTASNGCKVNCAYEIMVQSGLIVPTGFSPNGDGINDIFRILNDNITLQSLSIYNRWGELVFFTTQQSEGWDGTYKDAEQPMETYVWLAEYMVTNTGKQKSAKGNVTLVR